MNPTPGSVWMSSSSFDLAEQLGHPLLEVLDPGVQLIEFRRCRDWSRTVSGVGTCSRRLGEDSSVPRTPNRSVTSARLQAVLREIGVDAILQLRALSHEHHACARKLTCVSQRSRGNPHRRQRPGSLKAVDSPSIQLVGLVDRSAHQLRLPRIDQSRHHPRRFDLVGDPVPVADRLDRNRRSRFELLEESSQRASCVIDPLLP